MGQLDTRSVDLSHLEANVGSLSDSFATAHPFRHVIVDRFLPEAIARVASRSFPPFGAMQSRYAGLVEARAIERRVERLEPVFREIFKTLYAPAFIDWIERVTGIEGLEPDWTFNGTGLHQVRKGGYHNVHADENRHPTTGLYQRINLLVYLNERWEPDWGGALELWDAKMQRAQTSVPPLFNRALIMETHDLAFHGYPPIDWPETETRRSITCWYFTKTPGALQGVEPRPTVFRARPNDSFKRRAKHHLHRFIRYLRQTTGRLRRDRREHKAGGAGSGAALR